MSNNLWLYNPRVGKILALVLVAMLFVLVPDVASAQDSGGGGGGGWVDPEPSTCDGTCQSWLTLGWWLFVIGVAILTGTPL
jgi:hypothetical protein